MKYSHFLVCLFYNIFLLRLFCIGFTRKQDQSTKKTCYAQSAQVKNIRKKMVDIITREVSTTDLKEVVNKLIPDSIARDIEKACQGDNHIFYRA